MIYIITLDTLDKMVYTSDILATNIQQKPKEAIMARALAERTTKEQLRSQATFSLVQHESTCTRCGGLMVHDFCLDVLTSIGESKFDAKRCVQCGEVVDPVILRNRGSRQEPMTSRSGSFSNDSVESLSVNR